MRGACPCLVDRGDIARMMEEVERNEENFNQTVFSRVPHPGII